MSDDVQVQFGASTDDLSAGAKRAKAEIQGVVDFTDQLGEKLTHLAELFGLAFSIEKIAEFIERMAELGLQTERTMAMLGASAEQVGVLSGVAKLTGTSVEGLTTSFERMTLNIQKSTRDAFNPAAQGLKVLGLNAKDLIGLPADQYFLRLSDAVSKFNPSLNLTNAVMAVGGRGVAQLLPMLLKGTEGFREFADQVKATGAAMSGAQTQAYAQLHEKITLLSMSFQGLGLRILDYFMPALQKGADTLRGFLQAIDSAKINSFLKGFVDGIGEFAISVVALFETATAEIQKLFLRADYLRQFGFKALSPELRDQMMSELDQIDKGTKEKTDRISATLKSAMKTIKDYFDQQAALSSNASAHGDDHATPRLNAPGMDTQAKDAFDAAMKAANDQIALAEKVYQQKVILYDAEAAQFKITQDQKFGLLQQAEAQQFATEKAAISRLETLRSQMTLAQRQELDDKIKALQQKHNTDMLKLDEQSIAAQQKIWTGYLTTITSAFNSNLKGLLEGTTTWTQAMKTTLESLLIKFIEMCEEMAVKWAAKEIAETTATTTGQAARAAAETTGASASMLLTIGNALKSIFASVGQTVAGVTANQAPLVGPAAIGEGAAAGAATLAAATAFLPSFDIGSREITRSGIAMIHQGETIATAQSAGPWQGGQDPSSDTHLHFNISAVDAASFTSFLKFGGGGRAIANEIAKHMQQNPDHWRTALA